MTIIEQINADFMAAYKAKDMETKDFLGFIKSEYTREDKNPTDEYLISKLKKMLANAEELGLSENEIAILDTYVPKQMSEGELREKIQFYINLKSLSSMKDMGRVMTFLKEGFTGRYDGKTASNIAKELLG